MKCIFSVSVTESCLEGQILYRGKCFEISKESEDLTWDEANSQCKLLGGSLPSIRHEEEKQFLIGKIT